jgi:hypothetical protein
MEKISSFGRTVSWKPTSGKKIEFLPLKFGWMNIT